MLSEICKNLSAELIAQRKALRLSQEELAQLVGKTKKTIRTYEKSDYRGANLEIIIKIAEVLEEYRSAAIECNNPD